jgi:chromosome segregation ATPase
MQALLLQSFLRSAILYCYFRKVSADDKGEEELKKKLAEAEEENARLKAVVTKHKDDLRVLGDHSAMMEIEASDASNARDRAVAELASMSEDIQGMRARLATLQESHDALQAAHAELQEDHSILKEELGLLEEKHNETLEQLKESQATVEKVSEGKLVAEERYKHFHGEHRKLTHRLKKAEAKAANYLHQLSFASRVRDAAWADGMYLGFETFRTWWKDPAQRVDLNSVNIEDIPCTSEAIRCLLSFGAE